jgi:ERCC4-related helicase
MDNPKKLTKPGTQNTGRRQTNKKNHRKLKVPTKPEGEPRCTRKASNPCLAQDTCKGTHAKMNNVLNVVERLFCKNKNKTILVVV